MVNVYIALISNSSRGFDLSQYNEVINLFNIQYPNNELIIEKYLIDGSIEQINQTLNSFIQKYPLGKRATVSNTSDILTGCSNYMINNNLDILNLSLTATSNYIQTLQNVITYAPFSQFSVMSIFLLFTDYQMDEICILYDKSTDNNLFFNDFLNQINIQAILLNVNVIIHTLQPNKTNYNINSKSLIIMLSTTYNLTNIYVTNKFLNYIPNDCFIVLTNINNSIKDIFNNVPTLVVYPTSINYTNTTQQVYNAVKNNSSGYDYSSYTLYDIIFVLNVFTSNNLPITKNNFITINPYNDIQPAWLLNTYINPNINGVPYGNFTFIFTKNIIIDKDQKLFIKYYQGGQVSLADSYSILKIVGITYDNASLINYDESEYYKVYDKYNNKILVRYNSDITNYPSSIKSLFFDIGITIQTKFLYNYNSDRYFTSLKRLFSFNEKIPLVNSTMSKYPIKLKYN